MKKKKIYKSITIFIFVIIFPFPVGIFTQENIEPHFDRDTIITAARKMMETARYCAFITLDSTGHPVARMMDPFSPDDDMVVWFGTNIYSRKVKEIKNDSRVTLYYQAPNGVGYVLIKGQAYMIDNPLKKQTYWKTEWDRFYPDKNSNYTLIKVIPAKLEIIDYQHGIVGDSITWAVPFVAFKPSKSN